MDVASVVDPSVDNTIATPRNSENTEIPQKCFRKGDVIYYAKPENINMIRKNVSTGKSDVSDARPSLATDGQTDTINSGESLFKVFTFEQSSNDEDTEKCIAFWKSVMEKNLTPIKCTIMENTKNPISEDNQKQISLEEEPSQANCDDVVKKIHDEYRNMWVSALRQIQKKKLHEIKLTAKARCKMCDSISSSVDEYVDKIDKRAIRKEIKELNNWKSISTKKQLRNVKQTNSKTKTSSSSSLSNYTSPVKGQDIKTLTNAKKSSKEPVNKKSDSSTGILEKTKTESSTDAFIKEKNNKNLLPDTKTYIYIDAIGEKKKGGGYSKWRSNALEEVCQCKTSICSCNINPAIVAIDKTESDPTSADVGNTQQCVPKKINQGVEGSLLQSKDGEDQAKSENSINEKMPECNAEQKKIQADVKDSPAQINESDADQSKSQSLNSPADDRFAEPKDIPADVKDSPAQINQSDADQSKSQSLISPADDRFTDENCIPVQRNQVISTSALLKNRGKGKERNLSLFLQCACSSSSCDCSSYKEFLSRKIDTTRDWDIPRPTTKNSLTRRSSLEIYRKSLSKTDVFSKKQNSLSSMNFDVPANTVSSIGNASTRQISQQNVIENDPKTQTPDPGNPERTISLMLNECRCGNEDCDCYQIETIHREHRNTDHAPLATPKTPSRMVTEKVDSLVLSRRRLSADLREMSSVQVLYSPSNFDDDRSDLNEN